MCKVRSELLLLVALVIGLAHSWDIALSAGDRLEFYTLDGTKTKTVQFISQNLSSLAYDELHNMLLYVDKKNENDAICSYNINSAEYKCYTERGGRNINSLAFDPVTESLYFTETKERSISWFSFKPDSKNKINGNLLIKMDNGIPTNIAVDSCRGYIYWINKKLPTSTIERARLDGSEREVVINAKYNLDLHSLAIDQQTEKMYWIMPETTDISHLYSAFLNGRDSDAMSQFTGMGEIKSFAEPNILTVSKSYLIIADWCSKCTSKFVWKNHIPEVQGDVDFTPLFEVKTESFVGVTANYKMKEQFLGKSDCSQVLNNKSETNRAFEFAKEYEGPFCVYGTKISGQSLCDCKPGYIGERCDVSVCENYCLKGNCSFTEAGLPECSCDAGYSGGRCEIDSCHQYCSNNGTCSLNEEDQPVCECLGDYVGERCEVSACVNNGDGKESNDHRHHEKYGYIRGILNFSDIISSELV